MTIEVKDNTTRNLVKASRVAEEFGVTARTVRNWYDAGHIPAAFKAGSTIRFDLEAVRTAICGPSSKQETKVAEAVQSALREPSGFLGT